MSLEWHFSKDNTLWTFHKDVISFHKSSQYPDVIWYSLNDLVTQTNQPKLWATCHISLYRSETVPLWIDKRHPISYHHTIFSFLTVSNVVILTVHIKRKYELFLQWNMILNFGSCQNCMSSANLVTEIH